MFTEPSSDKSYCDSITDWISRAEKARETLHKIPPRSEDVAGSQNDAGTEFVGSSICEQSVNTELSSTKLESSRAFVSRRNEI